MSFPFFISRRYLFSKKKNNLINLISSISIIGIAIATMAMVCVLSGFNGFTDLISSLFTRFDPPLIVLPSEGKTMLTDDPTLQKLRSNTYVYRASNVLEDQALILFKGHPLVIRLKGVDNKYTEVTDLKQILYGEGQLSFERAGVHYGVPGIHLAQQLGGLHFGPTQICVPRKGERINTANPLESINVDDIYGNGLCFQVRQPQYDNNMMLCDLRFAQHLFSDSGRISQVELRLQPHTDIKEAQRTLQGIAGSRYKILNRYEQHAETYKIMNIEKMFAFIFLSFILFVATLNIVGSITMIMLDKRYDMQTLEALGTTKKQRTRIFLYEGRLITLLGATIGMVLGLLLCLSQQQWGWIPLGDNSENFIIDHYPISIYMGDLLLIYATTILVGFIAVWYPVYYMNRKERK